MLLSLSEIVEEYSNSNIEIHTFNQARGPFLSQLPCIVTENFLSLPSKGKLGRMPGILRIMVMCSSPWTIVGNLTSYLPRNLFSSGLSGSFLNYP
ncbi:hypothetical protein BS78_04G292900 [Paspalum vaginatum]|nr:hypothetical protein BS78_04G292900 [Paspalum vaginatum]